MRKAKTQAEADNDMLLAARVIESWRLCAKQSCRRARECRGDARACCYRLGAWSEVMALQDKRVNFWDAIERLRAQ